MIKQYNYVVQMHSQLSLLIMNEHNKPLKLGQTGLYKQIFLLLGQGAQNLGQLSQVKLYPVSVPIYT